MTAPVSLSAIVWICESHSASRNRFLFVQLTAWVTYALCEHLVPALQFIESVRSRGGSGSNGEHWAPAIIFLFLWRQKSHATMNKIKSVANPCVLFRLHSLSRTLMPISSKIRNVLFSLSPSRYVLSVCVCVCANNAPYSDNSRYAATFLHDTLWMNLDIRHAVLSYALNERRDAAGSADETLIVAKVNNA